MAESFKKTTSIEDLLDAGLHFGHQTKRWNPKMKRFIFGAKNGIYIIDLTKTLAQLQLAQLFLNDVVLRGQKVLFVGTKKQAREICRDKATELEQPYVIHRWLGGMLTNNKTIRSSVTRMRELQKMEADGSMDKLLKKEVSVLRREKIKLERNLTGIADMEKPPGAIFIVDICREKLAIAEAKRLNIPVVALVDTNGNPEEVDYPIPGNDDSLRSIGLIADVLGETIKEAHEIYAAKARAAKEARDKAEAEDREKANIAREERQKKEADEKKKREEILKKIKAEKKKADDKKKAEERAAAPAVEAKEEEAEAKPKKKKAAQAEATEEAPADEPAEEEAKPKAKKKPAKAEEAVAEEKPAEEAKEEAPAEEAPVAEEVAEAPAEEPAAEEVPAEEPKEEAPAEEAPVAEEAAEAPAEEPAVEEVPAEEPKEEAPAEEPVEEVKAEAPAEEPEKAAEAPAEETEAEAKKED